jgi:lysozyme
MQPTALQLATALIESFEGLRLISYPDQRGIWTVGFGSTYIDGKPVVASQTITQAQAEAALEAYLSPLLDRVAGKPPIAQAAYLSFAYNCGQGALLRVLASEGLPDGDAMKVTIMQFDHIGNVVSDALKRRRTVEQMLIDAAS